MATKKTLTKTAVRNTQRIVAGTTTVARPRDQVMTDLCEHLSAGKSLWKACEAVSDAPHPSSVLKWVEKYPDLEQQYAHAREVGYKLLGDAIMEIADEPIPSTESGMKDSGAVAHQRLRVDTRKWMLSKMLPKIYGERTETVHSGSMQITQPIDQVKLELALMMKNG